MAEALLSAARTGDAAAVACALQDGADIDMTLDEDCGQWTPLHLLAADGDTEACKALLDAGASPSNPCTFDGYEALHLAARNGHISTALCLIEAGASVGAVDKNGYTPLHYSAAFGHPMMAEMLIKRGAATTVEDSMGCTPAALAKAAGHEEAYLVISNSASAEAEIGRVARWLTGIGLLQYTDRFVEAGLDDLDFIAQMTFEDRDLDQLGVTILGHRKKLASHWRIAEFLKGGSQDVPAGEDKGKVEEANPSEAPTVATTEASGADSDDNSGSDDDSGSDGSGDDDSGDDDSDEDDSDSDDE